MAAEHAPAPAAAAGPVTEPPGADVQPGRLPPIVVYSSLFPSSVQPTAGLFVRERMFRLASRAPLTVVAPQPWFPLQGLIRRFRPGYRPEPPARETQHGIEVLFPRFLALPGMGRRWDSLSMALCTWPLLRRLRAQGRLGVLDSHFAYPNGHAAVLLGRWLRVPVTVTLRGTELRHLSTPGLRSRVLAAVRGASQVFSVSDSLRQLLLQQGAPANRIQVVGNGVDLARFQPQPQAAARVALGLAADAQVLVSVGGLVPRKGFHRVIELLPALRGRFPQLQYLVVGGPSPEGDMGAALRRQVAEAGLQGCVHFTGALPPERLSSVLSAADVFVLATANEGWANVFLEAMACGLPVVTTQVGGNAEVVCAPHLGRVVPFGDAPALQAALEEALSTPWDRQRIIEHARANTWDQRVAVLASHFARFADSPAPGAGAQRTP